MLFLRSFINFFMVPMIFFAIYHRNELDKLKPDFPFLMKYCILVCVNIPVTRLFTFFARILIGTEMEADSSYYTICAILASALLAFLLEMYDKMKNKA